MIIPWLGESTNVINIDFCIFNISEDVFHYFLSVIRGAFNSLTAISDLAGEKLVLFGMYILYFYVEIVQ